MCATRVVGTSRSAEDWLAGLGSKAADGKKQKGEPSEGDQDYRDQERSARKPKAKPSASGSGSAGKALSAPSGRRKVYSSQQRRELGVCQAIAREAAARIELSGSNDGLQSLVEAGPNAIEQLLSKLTKKLEPTTTSTLTYKPENCDNLDDINDLEEQDESLGTIGAKLVAEMQSHFSKLLPLKTLVEAMTASGVVNSVYMRAAMMRCEQADIKLPALVMWKVLALDTMQALSDGNIEEIATILAGRAQDGTDETDNRSLRGMVADKKSAKQVQDKIMLQLLDKSFASDKDVGEELPPHVKAFEPLADSILACLLPPAPF